MSMESHSHEHEFEPQYGLPERLPQGETILWQASPDVATLARHTRVDGFPAVLDFAFQSTVTEIVARKANAYQAGTAIMIPKKAISVISAAGQPFHDAAADEALFSALKANARVPVQEFDLAINDKEFAQACAYKLIELIGCRS